MTRKKSSLWLKRPKQGKKQKNNSGSDSQCTNSSTRKRKLYQQSPSKPMCFKTGISPFLFSPGYTK